MSQLCLFFEVNKLHFERGKMCASIFWLQNWFLGCFNLKTRDFCGTYLKKGSKKVKFLLLSLQNWPIYRGGCPIYRENFNIEVYGSEMGIQNSALIMRWPLYQWPLYRVFTVFCIVHDFVIDTRWKN
jgi:hypothetical protein